MPRSLRSVLAPSPLPEVFFASQHLPSVVAANLRYGKWERVGRGAFVSRMPDENLYARQRRLSLARIVALAHTSSIPLWISHVSAALLWGLPVPVRPGPVHVTQRLRPSTAKARRAGVTRHIHHLPEHHRTLCQGIPVTSPARTVVDSLRLLPVLESLAIADAALHRGVGLELIEAVLTDLGSRPGAARARELLVFADPGAESPAETATRVNILRGGLPRPMTQLKVTTRLGSFWADLGWREWKLLLEYDGRPKYTDQGTEAVIREKRRHDAIVEAGFRLLRVTKEDLRDPDELIRRILTNAPRGFTPGPCPPALR